MLHECSLKSTGVFNAANFKKWKFHLSLTPLLSVLKSDMTMRGGKGNFYLFLNISDILMFLYWFHTDNLFHNCVDVAFSVLLYVPLVPYKVSARSMSSQMWLKADPWQRCLRLDWINNALNYKSLSSLDLALFADVTLRSSLTVTEPQCEFPRVRQIRSPSNCTHIGRDCGLSSLFSCSFFSLSYRINKWTWINFCLA